MIKKINKIIILVLLMLQPEICEANSFFKLHNFQEVDNKTKDITLIFKKQLNNNYQFTNRVMFLDYGEKIFLSTSTQKTTIRRTNIIAIMYEAIDVNIGLLKMSFLTRHSKDPDDFFEKMIVFGQISKNDYLILKERYCKNINFEETN